MGSPKEKQVRAAKDRLEKGIAETQIKAGVSPNLEKARPFINDVLQQVVRQREETPERPAPPAPAVDLGGREDEEGTRSIYRPVGNIILDRHTGAAQFKGRPPSTQAQRDEKQRLLHDRLMFLRRLPEWNERVRKAWFHTAGDVHAKSAAVIRIVEQSKMVFGEIKPGEQHMPLVVSR